MKRRTESDKCAKCGETEKDVELEVMPCCEGLLCWDFCLYEMPEICPLCGARIRVEPKDPCTKEAYVEVIANKPTEVEWKVNKMNDSRVLNLGDGFVRIDIDKFIGDKDEYVVYVNGKYSKSFPIKSLKKAKKYGIEVAEKYLRQCIEELEYYEITHKIEAKK